MKNRCSNNRKKKTNLEKLNKKIQKIKRRKKE